MKKSLEFLTKLYKNNNKSWFDANKQEYLAAKDEFNTFATKLIEKMGVVDPMVAGLDIKQCTYRINRDVRFSNNKAPYKTHFGVYIAPKGKKSPYAGYYFHIEPIGDNFIGNNALVAGLYCPESKVLESARTEVYDNTQLFFDNIKNAKGFELDMSNSLKKAPKGFPSDFEFVDYLKLKEYLIHHPMGENELLSDNLLNIVVDRFASTVPFIEQINRAVDYVLNEE